MHRTLNAIAMMLVGFLGVNLGQETQQPAESTYILPIRVDEVNLTFQVTDVNGLRIDDLTLDDLKLRDNGRKPERILAFRRRTDLPIRVGVLVDTSRSMAYIVPVVQPIVRALGTQILRRQGDRSFVMWFDFERRLVQDWTNDPETLNAALHSLSRQLEYSKSRMGGTSIYDAVYAACRDEFSEQRTGHQPASNIILLFSDGEDNQSHARLSDAISMCQENHTAVYCFFYQGRRRKPRTEGGKVLQKLTEQSGGNLLTYHGDPGEMTTLRILERDLRDNYLLIYKPPNLELDGSFHRIKLTCPGRNGMVAVRSGYYAPTPSANLRQAK